MDLPPPDEQHDPDLDLRMSDLPDRPVDALPLDKPAQCAVCGYDLRGKDINSLCPECGLPVEETIAARGQTGTWRSRISAAIGDEFLPMALVVLFGNLSILALGSGWLWLLLPFWVTAIGISLLRIADLTEPMPGEPGLRAHYAHLRFRWVVAAMPLWLPLGTLVGIGAIVAYAMLVTGQSVAAQPVVSLIAVAAVLRYLLVGAYLFATFRFLKLMIAGAILGALYLVVALSQAPLALWAVSPAGGGFGIIQLAFFLLFTAALTIAPVLLLGMCSTALRDNIDNRAGWLQSLRRAEQQEADGAGEDADAGDAVPLREDDFDDYDERAGEPGSGSRVKRPPREIREDTYCVKCRYSLRTLMTDADCPECGTPIAETLQSDVGTSTRAWRNAVSSAVREEAAPVLITLGAMVPPMVLPIEIITWLVLVVWFGGVVLALMKVGPLTRPHPSDTSAGDWLQPHRLVAASPAILMLALLGLLFGMAMTSTFTQAGLKLGLGALAALRFGIVGWWIAHLVHQAQPYSLTYLHVGAMATTVAIAQMLFMWFLPLPGGGVYYCSAALLVLGLAGWAMYVFGLAGDAIEPPLESDDTP